MRSHVKPAVLRALRANLRARDDNRWLYVEVLKQCGFPVKPELEATVEQWPQIESVRRARARIQNEEGRLLPSDSVREQRGLRRRPRGGSG